MASRVFNSKLLVALLSEYLWQRRLFAACQSFKSSP
jgi:hypothetical protein